MTVNFTKLEENKLSGQSLGRHIKHDERSAEYALGKLLSPSDGLKSKAWTRHGAAWDQGDMSCCTGNAMAGLLMTDPFWVSGRSFNEQTAISIYSKATQIAPIDGESYPPNDTGSSGIDVAKAAVFFKYITSYHHGFKMDHVQRYVSNQAGVIIGINWYDSFDQTDSDGVISLPDTATSRGGHEVYIAEIDMEKERFGLWNSWGDSYGIHGKFYMPFTIFERLMSEDGDVTACVTASNK